MEWGRDRPTGPTLGTEVACGGGITVLTTRRAMLMLPLACAASALAGCTMAMRVFRVIAPTLTLPPSPLRGWDDLISRLWAEGGERFKLKVLSGGATGESPDATWVAEATSGASVAPLMKATNLPAGELAAWAWDAFADTSGAPTAFPIALGQLQFYVHSSALKATGIDDVPEWTWEGMEQALATAGPSPIKLLATGWGWGNPATWRALVFGLTGTLISSPVAAKDATAIVAGTTRLVDMARQAKWGPMGQLGSGASPVQVFDLFAQVGWSQQLAMQVLGIQNPNAHYAPLFAFMPPWTMNVVSGVAIGVERFPPDCYVSGGCMIVPRTFPKLPAKDVVPTFAWGLQPSANSPRQDLLAEFVRWLYAPDQQRTLGTLGLVPLIRDNRVQTEWQRMTPPGSHVPLFDPNRYFSPAYTFLKPDPDLGPYDQLFQEMYFSRKADGVPTALAKIGI